MLSVLQLSVMNHAGSLLSLIFCLFWVFFFSNVAKSLNLGFQLMEVELHFSFVLDIG